MFSVVKIELTDDGLETRILRHRSKTLTECWNYICNRALHPKKEVREEAKELFVFDSCNKMIPFIPHYVKRVIY